MDSHRHHRGCRGRRGFVAAFFGSNYATPACPGDTFCLFTNSRSAAPVMTFSRFRFAAAAVALVLIAAPAVRSVAGLTGGIRNGAVGGVMIAPSGSVRTATKAERREMAAIIADHVDEIRGDLAMPAQTRVLSLSGLTAAINDVSMGKTPLSDELIYLAGLQRIDYVLVDRENNDVCIAGPAEPWRVAEDGSVVGQTSGQSPIRLIDLMMAFASVEDARDGGISCSIEPTAEGRRKLQTMLRGVKLRPGQNPSSLEPAMRQAFGPQMILVDGVPNDSRMARTMVAADFEMKRIAMGLAPSPVDEVPSYLQMARNAKHGASQNPRWWLTCDYDAIARDEDRTTWRLSGSSDTNRRVKTMTDLDMVHRDGSVAAGGQSDVLAQAWADKMTEYYESMSVAIPVLADLENIMDVTVAATLITQENLAGDVGMDLSTLSNPSGSLEPVSYPTPESVDPQCSFIRGRAGWVVTASGGIDISGFEVVENQQIDPSLSETAAGLLTKTNQSRWWWDAK